MVLYRSSGRGKSLSRDELVTRGFEAAAVAEESYNNRERTGKWLYKIKLKSGRRAMVNAEYEAWNIPHLRGLAIIDNAREDEMLSASMIGRIMKSSIRSIREDV